MSLQMETPLSAVRRWKPYPAYKPSGVEWLGEIPVAWEVKRLKFVAHLNMGQSPDSEECNIDGEGIPFLQGNAEFGNDHPTPKQFCSTARKHALPGDILISVRAPVGALNIADQVYGIGRGLCAIAIEECSLYQGFSWYLLQVTRQELNIHATGSTYDAVAVDEVGNMTLTIPPLPEQRAIASFLDRETAHIDALIAKKERLIELLQEKRAALISQAVTRGLDPGVKLKESGVAWLGQIPERWRFTPLRYLTARESGAIKAGPFGSDLTAKDMNGSDIKVYTQRNVINRDTEIGEDFISNDMYNRLSAFTVLPGDILLTSRGSIGRCFIVPLNAPLGILHPCLIRIRPNFDILLPEWLSLLIQDSLVIKTQFSLLSNATTIEVIYSDNLKEISIPLPPLKEQLEIIDHVNCQSSKIDALIEKIRQHIEKLKEFRAALITAAVTGKIDVRDAGGPHDS